MNMVFLQLIVTCVIVIKLSKAESESSTKWKIVKDRSELFLKNLRENKKNLKNH